ncbi:hypothetical protein HPP92_008944 [Vanilla planifolia]|uniref:Uncharacterized protein n=1 Tax=Vanilla planifolia TaxID=51239 RepID=A0A835V486_VANPL|nr:hypothetical protein HPP92_008944 [Vanilla planifolia]
MGRTLLSTLQTSPLPLPLLASFIVLLAISLAYALCASHNRKLSKQSPRPQPPPSESSSKELAPNPPTGTEGKNETATHGPIGPATSAAPPSTPRRKLAVSLSIKLPEGLSRALTGRREAPEKEIKEELESVWTKTIILGEKCKVPEDDNEEEGEAVLYDENGNRQRIYHPRTPRSMPISRTNSFVSVEVIPVS